MPELVMRDIPYEVDYYQIEPDAYRIIGIATMNPGFMAPAVRTMYNHILKQYKIYNDSLTCKTPTSSRFDYE